VSGYIYGLDQEGQNQSASSAVITSSPSPLNVPANAVFLYEREVAESATFDVSNGAITGIGKSPNGAIFFGPSNMQLILDYNGRINLLGTRSPDPDPRQSYNTLGFDGVTFKEVSGDLNLRPGQ
jgi:hypothetical protein